MIKKWIYAALMLIMIPLSIAEFATHEYWTADWRPRNKVAINPLYFVINDQSIYLNATPDCLYYKDDCLMTAASVNITINSTGNNNATLWSMFMNISGGKFTGGVNATDLQVNNVLYMANGSQTSPAIQRNYKPSNKVSGLYWEGTTVSRLYTVLDDVQTWRFTTVDLEALGSNAQILLATGSASSPSFTSNSDSTTGMYFTPTINGVAFSGQNNEIMRAIYSTTSKVGIATPSPSVALDVNGTINASYMLINTSPVCTPRNGFCNVSTSQYANLTQIMNNATILNLNDQRFMNISGGRFTGNILLNSTTGVDLTIGTPYTRDRTITINSASGAGNVTGTISTGAYSLYVQSTQWIALIAPGGFEMRTASNWYWQNSGAGNQIRATLGASSGNFDTHGTITSHAATGNYLNGSLAIGRYAAASYPLDVYGNTSNVTAYFRGATMAHSYVTVSDPAQKTSILEKKINITPFSAKTYSYKIVSNITDYKTEIDSKTKEITNIPSGSHLEYGREQLGLMVIDVPSECRINEGIDNYCLLSILYVEVQTLRKEIEILKQK